MFCHSTLENAFAQWKNGQTYDEVVIEAKKTEFMLKVNTKVDVLDAVDDDVNELHAGYLQSSHGMKTWMSEWVGFNVPPDTV